MPSTSNETMVDAEQVVLLGLDWVEIVLSCLFTGPISVLNFLLILNTAMLHPNLKFILLCQSGAIFGRSIARMFILATRVSRDDPYFGGTVMMNFSYGFTSFFRNFLAHVLVLERLMATWFVHNYEHWRRPFFSAAWFLLVSSFTLWNSLNPWVNNATLNLYTWNGVLGLVLAEAAAFFWIRHHNVDNFQNKMFARHNLSERYQLAENIRTARQLLPTLLLHFLNIGLGTASYWTNFTKLWGTPVRDHLFLYELVTQSVFCVVAAANFLIELSIIVCHPYLRRTLFNFLQAANNALKNCLLRTNTNNVRVFPAAGSLAATTAENSVEHIARMGIASQRPPPQKPSAIPAAAQASNSGGGGGVAATGGGGAIKTEADAYFEQLRRAWE